MAASVDEEASTDAVSVVTLLDSLTAFEGAPSRSRNRLATSLRTPSKALKKLVDPAAIAVPIASRVGPSCSWRCRSWNPSTACARE